MAWRESLAALRLPMARIVPLGAIGLAASSGTAALSLAAATGRLPAEYEVVLSQFSVSRYLWGIPVEFGVAAAFASLVALYIGLVRSRNGNVHAYTMLLSTVAFGGTLGLVLGNPSAWPLWVAAASAAAILAVSSSRETRRFGDVGRALAADLRMLPRRPATMAGLAAWTLAIVCVAQAVAALAAAGSRNEADARMLVSWFASQRPLNLSELHADQGIRVTIFTDHQCPACIGLVPLYRGVVSALALKGFSVDLEMHAFPLEMECNDVTGETVHPVACEAAAAIRLVSGELPEQAVRFDDWLYSSGRRLSRDSIRSELSRLGLERAFDARYPELLQRVRADAALGRRAGVYSTPTVFVSGIKLPSVTPAGLEKVLNYAAGVRAASSARGR